MLQTVNCKRYRGIEIDYVWHEIHMENKCFEQLATHSMQR